MNNVRRVLSPYGALVGGGIPTDATPATLAWLLKQHRFMAEHHTVAATRRWHAGWAYAVAVEMHERKPVETLQ